MSKKMTMEEAIDRLYKVAADVYDAGFVLSGSIAVADPPQRMVDSHAEKYVDPRMSFLRIRTIPRNGAGSYQPTGPKSPSTRGVLAAAIAPVIEAPFYLTDQDMLKVMTQASVAPAKTYAPDAKPTGDICSKCGGSRLQRMGTCLYCQDCGESNGCS